MTGNKRIEALSAVLLGVASFFFVVGPRALNPVNIAWLGHGDPATQYLGWHFFRGAGWSFPIGLNPPYGLEIGNAILFSDSNPLFAFLFKPWTTLLPEPFQYFGFWLLACFILQAWFGWKLAGLASDRFAPRILGAGLFVFAPPMLCRLPGNMILSGHFLVLAALYLALRPEGERRRWTWAALMAAAALIHAYLLAMTALLWLADLIGRTRRRRWPAGKGVREFVVHLLVIGFACWQAGYFSVGAGTSSVGFGHFRMNLLAVIDGGGWSYVLKDIPEGGGQAGSNFLGFGILILAVLAVPAIVRRSARIGKAVRAFPLLVLALAGLTAFAVSNTVGIGPFAFTVPLPAFVLKLANVFRGSERMFWPVFYAIVFAVIFLTVRGNGRRKAAFLMGLALLVQTVDTSAGWLGVRRGLMKAPRSTWTTPLLDPFWKEAASAYKKVRWIPPANYSPHWLPLAAYAGANGLATDAVYLARVNAAALERSRSRAWEWLLTGRYETDALYVLDDSVLRQAAYSVDPRSDALFRMDGLNVLAPEWKKRAGRPLLAEEIGLFDVLPPLRIGEKMATGRSGAGTAYLFKGWSTPEDWGTWSDGEAAEIVLPVRDPVRSVVLEAGALLTPAHPRQDIIVEVDDVRVYSASLSYGTEPLIEIPLPEKSRARIFAPSLVRIRLRFANAVRPKDLGLNDDGRTLALGLRSITVR